MNLLLDKYLLKNSHILIRPYFPGVIGVSKLKHSKGLVWLFALVLVDMYIGAWFIAVPAEILKIRGGGGHIVKQGITLEFLTPVKNSILLLFLQNLGGHQICSIITSCNTSCLKAHAGFFWLLIKEIFDPYVQLIS